ncbi:MAG: EscU/YscU/HrcU family type III secretion system export apparatus switch protein [Cellulosilyticaceae bacterium]
MKEQMKKAVALSYDGNQNAPTVVASGKGLVAENILREAQIHDVPVYEDAKLATLLTELEIGNQIPKELYEIVARILVFVGDVDTLYGKINSKESK